MQLLTDELLAQLQAQDPYHPSGPRKELSKEQYMVVCKFFAVGSNWTWYPVSASKDEESGDVQFFGLVDGFEVELGYFWLSELKEASSLLHPIERDLFWEPVSLAEVMQRVKR